MIANEQQAREYVAQFADAPAMTRLDRLAELLIAENQRQNLIAKPTIDSLWQRHIADSAQLLAHVPRETQGMMDQSGIWLDLGTGAGFPGLVIAILRPDWDVRMVESRRRRVDWLEEMRIVLGLARSSVFGGRVELAEDISACVISARAFAPMPRLLDLSARFSTEGTLWLLPKGRSAAQDLAMLPESRSRLFHVEQSCTDSEAGIIVGHLRQKVRTRSK